VRKIEAQRNRSVGFHKEGLSKGVTSKLDLASGLIEVEIKDIAQHSMRKNARQPVPLEAKPYCRFVLVKVEDLD
jgi:hypothetical protein